MKYILLYLLTMLFAFHSSAQVDDNLATGNWRGNGQRFMMGYYSIELSVAKMENGTYKGIFSWRGGNALIMYGTFDHGALILKSNSQVNNCVAGVKLQLSFNGKEGFLKGGGCAYLGYMELTRKLSKEELAKHNENIKEPMLSDPLVKDRLNDGVLKGNDNICLRFFVSSHLTIPEKSTFRLASGGLQLLPLTYGKLGQENMSTVSGNYVEFSVKALPVTNEISVPYKIYLTTNRDSTLIKEGSISIKSENAEDVNEFYSVEKIMGTWISQTRNFVYYFDNDSTYKTSYFEGDKEYNTIGNWVHFRGYCDNQEYLSLSRTYNPVSSVYNTTDVYRLLNNSQHISRNDQMSLFRNLENGGFAEQRLFKLEENGADDSLVQKLNFWAAGKWEDNSEIRYNLKEDHKATQWDDLNQSDIGNWFCTYKIENQQTHVYLWICLGRQRGTEKLEVAIDKSDENTIYAKDVTKPDADYIIMHRNSSLEVPENIIGLRPGEILLFDFLPKTLFGYDNSFTKTFETIHGTLYGQKMDNDFYSKLKNEVRSANLK